MAHKIPEYKGVQYVTDKTTVDILWKQLKTLQDVAEELKTYFKIMAQKFCSS